MSWKDKVLGLCKRSGAPTKFAVNLTLGSLIPGAPAVVELILGILDCVHETAKDNLEFHTAKMPAASAADLQRVEQVLDVLNGDLSALMEKLAQLEQVPELARQTLETTLKTDERCRQAGHRLVDLARRFDRLEEQNRQLLDGQGYQTNLLEEVLSLMRRVCGVMARVEELCAAGLGLAEFRSLLHAFQDGAAALGQGRVVEAESLFLELAQAQPRSGATAIALAAAQVAAQNSFAAEKSLARAVRLRPDDAELKELHRGVSIVSPPGPTPPSSGRPRVKVGDVLDGWRLEQMLGSGGWGQVFKACRGERVRALKVMHPDLSRDPQFVERFKKEILTLAGLRGHPNLIAIEDFGYAADAVCWYFSMEFIDGLTLDQYLKKQGALSLTQACRLFVAVAAGLAAAHACGIVHRDIKPANILLRRPNDKPVLIDFGLAALAEGTGLTEAGRSAGYTAMFAAPEQLRGRTVDARSDVYSLAASLYYALVYDRPDVREPHLFEPEHVPEALRSILIEALHQHPHRRTQTVAAFREALQAKLSTVEVSIPGTVHSIPVDGSEAKWVEVKNTPAMIAFDPKQVYRLTVSEEVTDEQLAGLAHLRGLTNLRGLDLGGCDHLTDAGLAHLRGLTELRRLDLRGCHRLTDAGLAHLRGLTELRRLDLELNEQLTDSGLAHLRGLADLRLLNLSVDLGYSKLTDAGLAHLRGLTNLQSLNLEQHDELTDAGLAHLRGLTNLRGLILSGCYQLTGSGLAHLRGLTELRRLDLEGCGHLTDAGLAHLRRLTNLQSLDLSRCDELTDAGLAHLHGLTNLQWLDLSGDDYVNNVWLTDAGLAHLRGLTNLQSLGLSRCDELTDAGLAHLRRLTNLQWLDLSWCEQLTDAGLAHLRRLTNLQSLDLSHCSKLTDAGLAHLRRLTNLQSLDLRSCRGLTEEGLERLRALTNLQSLKMDSFERELDEQEYDDA